LHLPFEGSSRNIFDSDGEWVFSVEGSWAHNNNWVVERVLNTNSVPKVFLRLVDTNSSELNDSISADLGEESVLVQISLSEVHPLTIVSSECPRGSNLRRSGHV
jgi:hypothetical protein